MGAMTAQDTEPATVAAFALRHPVAVALGLVVSLGLAIASTFVWLRVEGDVAEALKGDSEAFLAFTAFEARFGAPSKDEVFLIEAADLGAPGVLAALEDLTIELQLTDGVADVLSLFSIPDPGGTALSFLSREDMAALPEAERLDRLLAEAPLARQVLAADRSATLLTVLPDRAVPAADRLAALDAALATADPALTVRSAGLSALQREISRALIADQVFLTPTAIIVCVIVALLLFRSWQAAVVCIVPALLALGWTFGFMGAAGIALSPVVAVVPALLIVVGVADTVHVHHAIARHMDDCTPPRAIARGMAETLPAVVLTTLTTALAFLSLLAVGSPTLAELAVVGAFGLAMTLVAVWLAVPLAERGMLAWRPPRWQGVEYRPVVRAALGMLPRRRLASLAGLALLVALAVVQSYSVAGFSLTDHVPKRSEFRQTLAELDRALPGSDQLFVVLDAADPAPGLSDADRARLSVATRVLYGAGTSLPADLGERARDSAASRRILGPDGAGFALPVPARLDDDWRGTLARADGVLAELDAAGLGAASHMAGYSLMSAVELPALVEELRLAFYIAVAAVTALAAVLMRSLRLALISVVPNLIPILGVEAVLVATDRPLTLTGAIALTVAFGIAVDDTIHVLNRLRLGHRNGAGDGPEAMAAALTEVAPPVITTSLVLIAGFALTMFSTLPSVSMFGGLVAGAMLLALISVLFLFPGLLLWGAGKGAKRP